MKLTDNQPYCGGAKLINLEFRPFNPFTNSHKFFVNDCHCHIIEISSGNILCTNCVMTNR